MCVYTNDFFDQILNPYFGFILDSLYANSLYARFVQDVYIADNEGCLYSILKGTRFEATRAQFYQLNDPKALLSFTNICAENSPYNLCCNYGTIPVIDAL